MGKDKILKDSDTFSLRLSVKEIKLINKCMGKCMKDMDILDLESLKVMTERIGKMVYIQTAMW